MKKIVLSLAAIALFASSDAQKLDRSIRPNAGPAPEIKLADPQTFTLPNGLKVFVVENHNTPIVSYSFQFDVDPVIPQGKEGLDEFIGSLMTSGTKKMNKQQFDEATDKIGATVAASGAGLYGKSMTKHQDALLQLMADALMNADFQQSELDKLKNQSKAGLEQNKTEPDAMLSNVTKVLNYGKNHPYAELATDASIDNVTLNDCKDYYSTYYRPNVSYLAVVGDITLEQAKALVTKYFGNWKKGTVPAAKFTTIDFPKTTTVDFVPRENSVQSVIAVTYPINLKPGDPDVIKTRMLNEILGGSGTGRLFLNLREKHGWTYGSYSSFDNDKVIGYFQAYAKARNAVTDSSINEILAEMNRIRDEKVDKTTLQDMKNYVNGVFAIGLESPQTIARYAINVDRYNMPKDYYKNYLKHVNAVTVEDIQATANKYIKPNAARIIVVGDKDEALKLKRFATDGTINYYDNYGNPIKAPTTAEAAADVSVESIMKNYVDAIGGKAAIEGLTSMTTSSSMSIQGQELLIIENIVSPDKYSMSLNAGAMGEVQRITVNGTSGKMTGMGQSQDLPAQMLGGYLEKANLQNVLNTDNYSKYTLKGIEQVDGKDCYVLEKKEDGQKEVNYYDKVTHLLLKNVTVDEATGSSQTSIYSDYKEVKGGNGYKAPYKIKVKSPQGDMDVTVNKVEINKKIKESEFK
ncbi:MAG TPA: insulinase family protein [Edaphocola sp.]|nr:insulinase family protein [Edaphocola sp.]